MGERFARIRIVYPALVRLALLGLTALAVDYFFGDRAALWFALVSFTSLLAFHFFYLSVLGAWLEKPSLDTVPEGAGAWSEVFARLYKSRRSGELNESRLAENEQRFDAFLLQVHTGVTPK